jgi:hypothetical protein
MAGQNISSGIRRTGIRGKIVEAVPAKEEAARRLAEVTFCHS